MSNFFDLPFPFVMNLYREKIKAEKRGDNIVIENLRRQYPDLFQDEFDDFVSNLRLTIEYLSHKYDEDFHKILDDSDNENDKYLH